MLFDNITIIVIAFYMRIYCHDHTSLSTQIPNTSKPTKPTKIQKKPASKPALPHVTRTTCKTTLDSPNSNAIQRSVVAVLQSPELPSISKQSK
jgi:hypothetical protein